MRGEGCRCGQCREVRIENRQPGNMPPIKTWGLNAFWFAASSCAIQCTTVGRKIVENVCAHVS